MEDDSIYKQIVTRLSRAFENSLKTVVLFGSRARGINKPTSDHDIFLIIDNLEPDPIKRQKQVRSLIWDIPLRINTIAKTSEEVSKNLTPLLLEVFVDGICLFGSKYFESYRNKVMIALKEAGLKRKRLGHEWYWQFDRIPQKEWELGWDGFHEFS